MSDSARIIDAIGQQELAEMLKQKPVTVRVWKIRGVPWQWRLAVSDIAQQLGIDVPRHFLPPRGPIIAAPKPDSGM